MARRFSPLTAQQVAVLRWVADGCPDGVWKDFSYKRTCYALAERRLIAVDRRRSSWAATVTDDGRYYLDTGSYREDESAAEAAEPGRSGPGRASVKERERFEVDPVDLLAELQHGDGTVTVEDPAAPLRAGYRSALRRAVNEQLVPAGYRLRHKGRDRGDLVIRLVPDDEEPARDVLPPVEVPEDLRSAHPAVLRLREHPDLLEVSEESRQRALLVVAGFAAECVRRGFEFGLRDDGKPSFQVRVSEVQFVFFMFEEMERRDVPDEDEAESAKYAWQRVRSSVQQVFSGRLGLRLGEQYSTVTWADRKRWSLQDKLPQVLEHLEQAAAGEVAQRERETVAREERRVAWEAAVAKAKVDFVADLNRKRLDRQLADRAKAAELRSFADDVDQVTGSADAEAVRGWAAWVREEADRVDPLLHPERLKEHVPDEVRPADLEAFMPDGMSAWRPPS